MRFVYVLVAFAVSATSAWSGQRLAMSDWRCVEDGKKSFARLEIDFSLAGVSDGIAPLWRVEEPFECEFPWGTLSIEVVGYNSPGDGKRCGLAEAWGLEVVANGQSVFRQRAQSARACFEDDFDPFLGTVRADRDLIEICQTRSSLSGSDTFDKLQNCTSVWQ